MHRLQTKSHMLKDMHPDANNKFSAHTFNLLFSVIISLSYAYMRGNQVRYFSMNEYICLQKEVIINELTGICNECSVYKCNVLTYDFNWLTTNNKKDKCDECIPRLKAVSALHNYFMINGHPCKAVMFNREIRSSTFLLQCDYPNVIQKMRISVIHWSARNTHTRLAHTASCVFANLHDTMRWLRACLYSCIEQVVMMCLWSE